MSQYDPHAMYDFLSQTPEKGLRQIMIDQKKFTESHFTALLKMIRNCPKQAFIEAFEKNDFPKIKFTPNETKLKEFFWKDCCDTLAARGIITPIAKTA